MDSKADLNFRERLEDPKSLSTSLLKQAFYKGLSAMNLPKNSLTTTYSVLALGLYQLHLGLLVPFFAQATRQDLMYPAWLDSVLPYLFVTHRIQIYIALTISLTALLSFGLTVLLEYFNKSVGRSLLRLITAVTSEFCSVVLFLPVAACTLQQVTAGSVSLITPVYLLCLVLVGGLRILRSIFHCELSHALKMLLSKAHSKVDWSEFIVLVLAIGLIACTRSLALMSVVWVGSAVYMLYNFYVYQPYYRLLVNVLVVTGWILGLLTSIGTGFQGYLPDFSCVLFTLVAYPIVLICYIGLVLQRQQALLRIKPTTPYLFELRVRMRVAQLESKKERRTEILREFAEAKLEFLYFPMLFLWEHYFLKDVYGNIDLAMNRLYLVKTIDSSYLEEWIREHPLKYPRTSGLWSVQIDYLFYIAFLNGTSLQHKPDTIKELESYYGLKKYRQLEKTILCQLVTILVNLQDSTPESAAIIEAQTPEAARAIESLTTFIRSTNITSRYNRELLYMSKGFVNDILKSTRILGGVLPSLLEYSAQNFNEPSQTSVLVFSAHRDSIGRVVYANHQARELLMYEGDELIGLHFSTLIPPPFDAIHEKVLRKFLLYRAEPKISRPHLYIIGKERTAIDVAMELYVVCFHLDLFFVATFTENPEISQFLLLTEDFYISSYSQNFSTIRVAEPGASLESVFPGITAFLSQGSFTYYMNDREYFCTLNTLSIDGNKVHVLYVSTQRGSTRIAQPRRNSAYEATMTSFIQEFKEEQEQCQNGDTILSNSAAALTESRGFGRKPERKLMTAALRYSRFTRTLMRIGILIIVLSMSSYLIAVQYSVASISLNALIKNVGALRLHTMKCVINARALQLIDAGEMLIHSRAEYQSQLLQSSITCKDLLREVVSESAALGTEDNFAVIEVSVYNKHFTEVSSETITLLEAIEKLYVLSASLAVADEIPADDDSFYFIFRNGPTVIFESIHQAVGLVTKSSHDKYDEDGIRQDLLTMLLGLPPAIMFIVVFLLTQRLEAISSKVWKLLKDVHKSKFARLHSLIVARIESFHPTVDIPIMSQKDLKHLHKTIRWPLVLKLIGMCIACGALCLVLIFILQSRFISSLKQSADFNQNGGFRRALPVLAFHWVRESAYVSDPANSYYTVVPEYIPIYSVEEEAEGYLDYFIALNREINFDSSWLRSNQIDDVIVGSGCETGEECGILSKGVHAALQEYVAVANRFLKDDAQDKEVLRKLEGYSEDLVAGFVYLVALYEEAEDKEIANMHDFSMLLLSLFMAILLLVYIVLIDWEPGRMQQKILSRLKLIRLLNKHAH